MPGWTALRTELTKSAYNGMTDQQARDAIAAAYPSILPKPFTLADVFGCIVLPGGGPDTTAIGKLRSSPTTTAVLDAVQAQDRATLVSLGQVAALAGDITSAQLTAIGVILSATIADPSGIVALPGWMSILTASDVHAARN